MKKQPIFVFLLFLSLAMASCDSGTETFQVQDIAEIKWQSDGSAMYGFIQSYSSTINSNQPAIGYNIAKFNTDGSVAQIYKTDPKSRVDFSNSLFISDDGSTAVTQLENDLYRYSIKTGTLEKLQTFFHLNVVSPDLHYAVGTPSPANQPIKTIDIYDLSVNPIRLVGHNAYVPGVASNSGVWLNNSTFGVTCIDSSGRRIFIFDTTATIKDTISGAETPFHNVAFNRASNTLFVIDHAGKATDFFVDSINLSTKARGNVLNVTVENFDVTNDKQTIVYSAYDTTHTISLKIRNLATLKEQTLTNDILRIISISPLGDKIAYIHGNVNFNQISVIPLIKP
jgi:dipeptidyl aminopeptidase/acylaminoacyl peptidase